MRVEGWLGAARTMLIALTTGWALRSLGAWGPRLVAPRYVGSSTSSETLEIVDPTNGYRNERTVRTETSVRKPDGQ